MSDFTSLIAPLFRDYASYRKASDHYGSTCETSLKLFDKHCKAHYPEVVELSQEMVDAWCQQRETEKNNTCLSRIYPIIGFIRYLRKRGKTDVTEPILPRKENMTYIPHAFTDVEPMSLI